jgi:hypothetical protein
LCRNRGDIECVSAGHEKHEWTSWAAMAAIFKDIDQALAKSKHRIAAEDAVASSSSIEDAASSSILEDTASSSNGDTAASSINEDAASSSLEDTASSNGDTVSSREDYKEEL